MRKPDGQNYDFVDINYKSPKKFEFQKQVDRIDLVEANKELKFEYKNRLEHADYSTDASTTAAASTADSRALSFPFPPRF